MIKILQVCSSVTIFHELTLLTNSSSKDQLKHHVEKKCFISRYQCLSCLLARNLISNVTVTINGVTSHSIDEYFLWYHYESRTENVSMSNEISHTLPLHAKKPKVLNFFTVSVWFEVIQYSFAPVSEDFLLQFLTDWAIFAGNFSGLLNM